MTYSCSHHVFNNPYATDGDNTFYSSFSAQPKTLDPARSYSSDEMIFIAQIYEPPLQYHYLKRPYVLEALTAQQVPQPKYYNDDMQPLGSHPDDSDIAYSIYDIKIKPHIYYQPHPALAVDKAHHYLYHHLNKSFINNIHDLQDFEQTGTRELLAEDYVYQIKRLANPAVKSPIFGYMSHYIIGLADYAKTLPKDVQSKFIDLRQYPLAGANVIDKYTFRITIKGKYPQFIYWLAMPFFAPIPWEADKFYAQPGMKQKNMTFDWYPIGTGPYQLTENDPNSQMVLEKNPNFHGEQYPEEGEASDIMEGLLDDKGAALPFIDKFVYSLEKESIPRWNKFLQGYYDRSGISSDSFDQAISVAADGKPYLSKALQDKDIKLQTTVEPTLFYLGYNWLDPVVGGHSERARKLRQAIAIAVDYEEFISIFMNGRGMIAHGPIPPGIFGNLPGEQGINPYVYRWHNGHAQRRSLAEAKALLQQAGYPEGRDIKTGKPLVLHLDTMSGGGPDERSRYDWYRKQFSKLGIQLHIRSTQYNRFQEKMRTGNAQLFFWGWHADYPDPENFLFLLYSKNSKVKYGGENASNYHSAAYDKLYDIMKNIPNGAKRQAIINQMLEIIRRDSPWIWGFHPKIFTLSHSWDRATKAHPIAKNTIKYIKINPQLRHDKRQKWNQPILWPIGLIMIIFALVLVPVILRYWRKEHQPPTLVEKK